MRVRIIFRLVQRIFLIVAPIASIIIWVPTVFVFVRCVRRRAFVLAVLCLPELIYAVVDGGGLIAWKLFNFHGVGNGFHGALAVFTGAMVLVMFVKTILEAFSQRSLFHFSLLGILLLAVSVFVYSRITGSISGFIYSGAAFSGAGMLCLAEALRARMNNRTEDAESALANSGLVFVLAALAPLALIGM